jgi:hypothetical protein
MLNRIQFPVYDNETETPFQIIYQAAIDQDKEKIKTVLEKACIDVRDKTYMTPVAKLAQENNVPAVEFLLTQFHASLRWAIFGYAKGLHFEAVNKILDEFPGNNTFLLCEVVYGYVYARRQDLAKRILEENPEKMTLLIRYYAYGLGHSGLDTNDLIIPIPTQYKSAFFTYLSRGYGYAGNTVGTTLSLHFWKDLDNQLLCEIARAFAIVDNNNALIELFKKYPQHRLIMLLELVFGYAQSGLLRRLNTLFKKEDMVFSAAITNALEGFLAGGHLAEADMLLAQVSAEIFSSANKVFLLAINGHGHPAKKLLAANPELWPEAIVGFIIQGDFPTVTARLTEDPDQNNLYTKKIISARAILNDSGGVDTIIKDNTDQLDELLNEAAASYALLGHIEALNNLLKHYTQRSQRSFLWLTVADGYARGNHFRHAMEFLKSDLEPNPEWMKAIAQGFMSQKLYESACAFLKKYPTYADYLLTCMAETAKETFEDEHTALLTLVSIQQDKFRNNLANKIQATAPNPNYNLTKLLPLATKLNGVMKQQAVSINLAKAWLDPTLQFLLLQGHLLVDKMKVPSNVYFHLLTFFVALDKTELNRLGYQLTRFVETAVQSAKNKVKNDEKKNTSLVSLLAKSKVKPCWQANPPARKPLADRSNVARFR